jgi:putative tricarboxylic transport membrane protein
VTTPPRPAGPAWPETLIGLGLLAVAAVVWWQTGAIATSPMYAKVGPRIFPYITAVGLGVLAVAMLVAGLRGGWQTDEEREVPVDWRAVVFVGAGLLANVLLIVPAGFTLASVVMFVLVAHGFGSRAPLRDGAIALVFALAAYFGFAKALGVNIGAGVIEKLLGG